MLENFIDILQKKKKEHSFKDFLEDIVSWYPLVLYRQKNLISLYPPGERSVPVIAHEDFIKSRDTLLNSGKEYDHRLSFFQQIQSLFKELPFSALYNYSGAENSDYAFSVLNSKNCYLSFTVISDCEDIYYSFAVKEGCSHVYNSAQVSNNSENIYQSACIIQSYNVFYAKYIENCSNVWFSTNMIGCKECLFCDGLENVSYYIDNLAYTKEEYFKKKSEYLCQSEEFDSWYAKVKKSSGANHGSTEVKNSEFVTNSHEVESGKRCQYIQGGKNIFVVGSPHENTHMYDAFEAGAHGNSHFYGVLNTGVHSEHVYNCEGIVTCNHVFYSRFLENCSYCFGCIGLQNKQFCILNKQYSKEERYLQVERICASMYKEGVLGDYFPASMNPFYFNDTIAFALGDFTKEEVVEKGFLRRNEQVKVDIPVGVEVVKVSELGAYEGQKNETNSSSHSEGHSLTGRIDPEILEKVIQDKQGNVYRVIKAEYSFLEKYTLPLPRTHWLDRLGSHF